MFVKRLLHSKRHKLSIISQLLLPLVFTLIALINAKTFPQPTDSPPLTLSTYNFQDNSVPWAADNFSATLGLAELYKTQWPGDKTHPVHVTNDDMELYLTSTGQDMGLGDFNRKI
ncbi:ATP-binding cassette sub- A member 3 [Desmophyllum pertusum]|uniref:ATP-binding cassette sub- A member 3 n=1 Tax=Desmophyllum pertusum TaxID=174260 RepID=A0A9X0CR82_9CNID|nr:ATP-binding cassette sub- A member 3 [Desmophyllum pertusum]